MRKASDPVEDRLLHLQRAVDDLGRRVRALEEGVNPELAIGSAMAPASGHAVLAPEAEVVRVLSLAGRTLVVFAGAYLLRALTEAGVLAAPAGVTLGVLYAAFWLLVAERGRAAGQRLASELYGGAAVAIALPLLWEAVTTRQLLDASSGALALAAVALAALFVAWRRELHGLAWTATAGSLAAGAALLVRTGEVAPYTLFFITLGIATLWLGYDRGWYGLRWPAALAADVAVVGLTTRALAAHTGESPAGAIGAQLLLLGAYLALIAARTLVRGRQVIPFEVVQAAAALVVGLGGALMVTSATDVGGLAVAVGSLLMGVGCYAVAFAFVARRQGRGVNFYFYTSLALALTLVGTMRVLSPPVLALTWGALAALLAWLGYRFGRSALAAHGAVYATAAWVASGLLAASAAAFLSAEPVWPAWTPTAGGVLVLLAGALSAPAPSGTEWGAAARVPRCVFALVVTLGAAAAATTLLVTSIAGSPALAAGMLPTIRTSVMALAAIAVAVAGRYERWAELRWFVYPALVAGAVRLLADDVRHSTAAMLVVALTVYGAALIAAPRLARTRSVQPHEPAPSRFTV